ncbi:SDR family oxidoreductase [Gemmata sp. G18]|uniref:SDR family oxidoreductase n=1 Tax=Gemmata palustris TaxID=2822762 RepID=A0ABS5BY83_9BACT|nr:SDR family oxidoreductase [Gemmata palustris]MBP3958654.1 SDR family oxidoreductase [Gemmata palustris]
MSTSRKVALVTGSATGVGRACAVRFAKLGYAVVVNYSKSETEAQETLALVEAEGVPALLCKTTVADAGAVNEMIAATEASFDRLDVLVNNAGTTHFVPHTDLDALTDQVWDDIFKVNVMGTFYCTRAAMPLLKASQGNVVNVTSVAGLTGLGSSIPYCASKAALNCMTQSLARAFGPDVRVNAVAPGPILTRWLEGREAHIAKFLEHAPLGRAANPDDIADAVVYLATGTTLTTGQVLVVDGGRTM